MFFSFLFTAFMIFPFWHDFFDQFQSRTFIGAVRACVRAHKIRLFVLFVAKTRERKKAAEKALNSQPEVEGKKKNNAAICGERKTVKNSRVIGAFWQIIMQRNLHFLFLLEAKIQLMKNIFVSITSADKWSSKISMRTASREKRTSGEREKWSL